MLIRSKDCLRRFRLNRRPHRITRARRSARRPRFTIICVCSMRAPARPIVRSTMRRCAQSVSQMVDAVLALPAETKLMIAAPVIVNRKGGQADFFAQMQAQGFIRFRISSGSGPARIYEAGALPSLKKNDQHTIEVIVDRLTVRPDRQQRLAESFETALRLAGGRALAIEMESVRTHAFSSNFACPFCAYSLQELEPRFFSFNSPLGACPECDGLGQKT